MRNDTFKQDVSGMPHCHRFSSVVIVFIVVLTYVVCFVDLTLCHKIVEMYVFRRKGKIAAHEFRCNVKCTSLTTSIVTSIVFDLGLAAIHGYMAQWLRGRPPDS